MKPYGVPIYGRVLAELRSLNALTQEDVSFACEHREHVKVAREEVSRYEREHARPTQAKLTAVCAVLGVAAGSATWRALIRTPTLDERLSAVADREGEEHVDRHAFLKTAGVSTAAAALTGCGESFERVAFMLRGQQRVDAGALQFLERQTRWLQDGFPAALPVGVLLAQARTHYDAAVALLDGSMTPTARQRLSVIAGATSGLVGCLQTFAGLWTPARGSLAAAAALGREAGHPGLEARALGSLARLYGLTGQPSDAVLETDYAERAFRVGAGGGMDANSRSWLTVQLALAKARRDDRRGFEAGIARAKGHLGGESATDIGGRWFGAWGDSSIEWHRGVGLLRLDDPVSARKVLERVVGERRPNSHKGLEASINLAEAYWRTGEPEEACRLLGEAHTECITAAHGTGLRLMHQTLDCMREQVKRLPSVGTLDSSKGPSIR